MDPELHEARMNLAALSLNYRDYPTAEENFRAVLTAQPKNYDGGHRPGRRAAREPQVRRGRAAVPGRPEAGPAERRTATSTSACSTRSTRASTRPTLQKAQQFYRDFLRPQRVGARSASDAEKRIKDIDDTMAALDEAAKLQKEAEELQRKAEEQQKKMEEEMKKMQEQEKQQQQAPPPAATGRRAGAAGAPPPPAAATGRSGRPAAATAAARFVSGRSPPSPEHRAGVAVATIQRNVDLPGTLRGAGLSETMLFVVRRPKEATDEASRRR